MDLPDFKYSWYGADVLLFARNAKGRELHASKEKLAEHSSYFNAIFFSGFYDEIDDMIEIPCDYETMLQILQAIHGKSVDDCLKDVTTPDGLVEMYRASDIFDILELKEKCAKRLEDDPVAAAYLTVKVRNHEALTSRIEKMSVLELKNFLDQKDERPLFSKKDAIWIYEKLAGCELPESFVRRTGVVEHIESCAMEIRNSRIDLGKRWYASDVRLATRHSAGMMLYTNSGFLASHSEHFHKMLSARRQANASNPNSQKEICAITMNVNYLTMKTILSILHLCNIEARRCMHNIFPPILLFDLYRAATKLHIPVITEFCEENFLGLATPIFLEFAICFKLHGLKPKMIEKMCAENLRDFLFTGYKDLTYMSFGEPRFVTSKPTDRTLSLNDLHCMMKTLYAKFAPPPDLSAMLVGNRPCFQSRPRCRFVPGTPCDAPPKNESEKKR